MFLGTGGERTIFQILTCHGVDIAAFSQVEAEAEVLLPAGTTLKVTGHMRQDDGLTIVTLVDDDRAPQMICDEPVGQSDTDSDDSD